MASGSVGRAFAPTQIATFLRGFESRVEVAAHPLPASTTSHRRPQRNEPAFDLRGELYRILGVDLTQVPGLQSPTVSAFLSEVGPSVERFASPKHFASWLGLCPDNRVTGGRVLSAATREVKSRTAYALRRAAQSLQRSQRALGDFFRRMKARLGAPEAITATAHKLARMVYRLLKFGTAYVKRGEAAYEQHFKNRLLRNLQKQASHLGYHLVPQPVR